MLKSLLVAPNVLLHLPLQRGFAATKAHIPTIRRLNTYARTLIAGYLCSISFYFATVLYFIPPGSPSPLLTRYQEFRHAESDVTFSMLTMDLVISPSNILPHMSSNGATEGDLTSSKAHVIKGEYETDFIRNDHVYSLFKDVTR